MAAEGQLNAVLVRRLRQRLLLCCPEWRKGRVSRSLVRGIWRLRWRLHYEQQVIGLRRS